MLSRVRSSKTQRALSTTASCQVLQLWPPPPAAQTELRKQQLRHGSMLILQQVVQNGTLRLLLKSSKCSVQLHPVHRTICRYWTAGSCCQMKGAPPTPVPIPHIRTGELFGGRA